jgi:TetR/AcrR family transcriptional regulator, acrAB operon repressor
MKKTKEEAALTRQMLLESALRVFNRKGYAQTTLEEVAKEAGVTRGALYWHFNNKFEMFQMVLQEKYNEVSSRILDIIDSDLKPLKKLRQLFLEFFHIMSNIKEYRMVEDIQLFRANPEEKYRQLYKSHVEKVKAFREWSKNIVREGIAVGEVDKNLDPELIILAMVSYIAGLKSAWLYGIDDISVEENAEILTDIFIKGISKG